jgi:hypothetical protein
MDYLALAGIVYGNITPILGPIWGIHRKLTEKMSVVIAENQTSQTNLSIINNQTGATMPATFGDKTFTSDNTAVFGIRVGVAPQTIEILATGPGTANMVISTESTFEGPISGKIVSLTKEKKIPVSVSESGGVFAVVLGD